VIGIGLGLKGSTHGDAETAAYSTWDMMMPRCPWAPPPAIEGMKIALSFNRRVFYLNVLKGRLVVYLGENRVMKSVDDFLNRKGVAWRHVEFVLRL
jgi:hypothetical protein